MAKVLNFNNSLPSKLMNAVSDSSWRVFVNAADDNSPAELLIMDEIGEDWLGDGVSAKGVVDFLGKHRDRDIDVRINSPGGLVYDGLVIYNALANHEKKVNVIIEGLAFSAASFIAMAGDTISMHEASDIGIHRAMGFGMGNRRQFAGLIEWLDVIDHHLVDIYQARTNLSREDIEGYLDGTDDGTLFPAKKAVELGFADAIIPAKKRDQAAATLDASKRIAAQHAIMQNKMRKLRR